MRGKHRVITYREGHEPLDRWNRQHYRGPFVVELDYGYKYGFVFPEWHGYLNFDTAKEALDWTNRWREDSGLHLLTECDIIELPKYTATERICKWLSNNFIVELDGKYE